LKCWDPSPTAVGVSALVHTVSETLAHNTWQLSGTLAKRRGHSVLFLVFHSPRCFCHLSLLLIVSDSATFWNTLAALFVLLCRWYHWGRDCCHLCYCCCLFHNSFLRLPTQPTLQMIKFQRRQEKTTQEKPFIAYIARKEVWPECLHQICVCSNH
jgi:hypothetical protein